jgi:hypothetical protein
MLTESSLNEIYSFVVLKLGSLNFMTSDKTIVQVLYTVCNFMGPRLSKAATGEANPEIPHIYGTRFQNRVEKSLLPGLILNEINSIHVFTQVSLRSL